MFRVNIVNYFVVFVVEIETHSNTPEHLKESTNNSNIGVIIVESVDKAYPNDKNKILVKPEFNPYYEQENHEDRENAQSISLENSIDKIKTMDNIYYE